MAKMIINGEVCSGSNSYASAIEYTKEDGSKTTVQDELREQNKNFEWKLAGSANGTNKVSLKNLEYNEIQLFVTCPVSAGGWYDSSIVVSKPVLLKQKLIFLPSYYATTSDFNFITCEYNAQDESVFISRNVAGGAQESTLEVYYR